MEIKKDNTPVIYKQDLINDDGKLTILGCFTVIALLTGAIKLACDYLDKCLVDKDKVC